MNRRKYTNPKDINFEEFRKFFEEHTRDETLKRFNLNIWNLQKLCKMHSYRRPDSIIKQQIKTQFKKTCLEKYGVECNLVLDEISKKAHTEEANAKRVASGVKTCLERYGVSNPGMLDKTKEAHRTPEYSEKMHNMHESLSEEDKKRTNDKRKKTCMERYGVPYYTCTEDCHNASHTKESIEKANESRKETTLIKYGVEHYSQTDEYQEKVKQTYLEKYGVDSYFKTDIFAHNRKRRYFYKNLYFDSSWELAFYIYHIDKGFDIVREPLKIEYKHNNKICYYFPDFLCGGQLIEIKGDQFFKDGKMTNIYNEGDSQFQAKYLCALQHNVLFITHSEIKPYLKYIDDNYGKNYLKSFIVSKGE